MFSRFLSFLLYLLTSLIGVAAFAYPFFLRVEQSEFGLAGGQRPEGGFLTTLLLILCLIALFIEAQGEQLSAKMIATLGILVAFTAVLRFLETAIPGPGGFSPVFVPIILGGYVFGPRFGFLLGTLTLFVSALITGGVGIWLPYQMFSAGWIGLGAGCLPTRWGDGPTHYLLIGYSALSGLLYGAVMNLYFWPFLAGDPAQSWQPGSGWRTALIHYALFYLATSLIWDVFRAVGNALFMMLIGRSTLFTLRRFQQRLQFHYDE